MFNWLKSILGSVGNRDQTPAPHPAKRLVTPEQMAAGTAAVKAAKELTQTMIRPANLIILDGSDAAGPCTASQLGGRPALPPGANLPVDHDGRPLVMLVQINFADMPPLVGFPNTGLLQVFFVPDDVMGLVFNEGNKPAHKVLYHPDPTGFVPGPIYPKSDDTGPNIAYVPFYWKDWNTVGKSIAFRPAMLPPTAGDYRIEALIKDHYGNMPEDEAQELFDSGEQQHAGAHGNIGGFSRFTQMDPRRVTNNAEYDICLLGLGYAENVMMWGDVGEFSLFIKPADLAKRNFDDTLYYWDCC